MSLKVIGAGYPRTGTLSLKSALEQLGFGPCHHMREIMMNPPNSALWIEAADAPGKANWDKVLEGYHSCTDVPGCTFWRELVAYYPSAKVILSVRDPEQWFESLQATVLGPEWVAGTLASPLKEFYEKAVCPEFSGHFNDRDFLLSQYSRHHDEVIRTAPKERLLVFDVRDGWAPLCTFLGVAIPEMPFPRTNSREEMLKMRGKIPK
ncbi:MAG: sulfotransferase family protein [Desulfobacterium sp.]|nr:sulfotransferase family protein [Desulfobacterium sp.]MBU4001452.1 sulfotransferase family protein [Pseudomonadota bacterium]